MSDILLNFCDLLCEHAEVPKEQGLDGSGSCRTFIAIYCNLKKTLVHKNMPCKIKVIKKTQNKMTDR
ncbi:MAG TPA: hypothetical protein PKW07_02360 [Syntrophorhabdaceae bacterium]|nr:hypothetical protein [Syntrophorhabdaceae bacterium]